MFPVSCAITVGIIIWFFISSSGKQFAIVPFLQFNGVGTVLLGYLEHLSGGLEFSLMIVADLSYYITIAIILNDFSIDCKFPHNIPPCEQKLLDLNITNVFTKVY
jgi:hypothetical protein